MPLKSPKAAGIVCSASNRAFDACWVLPSRRPATGSVCHPGVLLLPRNGPARVFPPCKPRAVSQSCELDPGGLTPSSGVDPGVGRGSPGQWCCCLARAGPAELSDTRGSTAVQGVLKDAGCSPAPAVLCSSYPRGRGSGKEGIPTDEGEAGGKRVRVCFMVA